MDDSSSSRVRWGIPLLLWLPLLGLPLAALRARPYTSHSEDILLLALLIILAVLQGTWKRWGDSKAAQILPSALWLFLFLISLRSWPVRWHLPLGIACAVYAVAVYRITAWLQPRRVQEKPRGVSLPVAAFIGAVLFVLMADGILARFHGSAPRPWLERMGFLWPVLFAAPAAYRLSGDSSVRRLALLALMILSAALFVKETRWTARLRTAAAEAEEAVREGKEGQAAPLLEQAFDWNKVKGIAGVEMQLHLARAALSLRQGEPLQALAAIEQGLEAAPPGQAAAALNLLERLSPGFAERFQAVPEWECSMVDLWVDVELPSGGESCWILNRWGEVYQGAPGSRQRSKLKENTRSARAVDLACRRTGSGALLLYSDGFVEAWGGSPGDRLERAIARYNIAPLPRAVDLEWAPGEEGFYVLSSSGRIACVGQVPPALAEAGRWSWKDRMAQALKAAPDGRALYLLDRRGGIHPAGRPAFDAFQRDAPYTEEPGIVADIEFSPDGTGLYFLDAFGGLHTIGGGNLPIPRGVLPYFQAPGMVDFEIAADGALVVLTCNGKLYADRLPQRAGSSSGPH